MEDHTGSGLVVGACCLIVELVDVADEGIDMIGFVVGKVDFVLYHVSESGTECRARFCRTYFFGFLELAVACLGKDFGVEREGESVSFPGLQAAYNSEVGEIGTVEVLCQGIAHCDFGRCVGHVVVVEAESMCGC